MQLYVNVKPNQRFNRLEQVGDDWIVRLHAPAVDGKANEALVDFLSDILHIARSKIVLRKGQTARVKCLEIEGNQEEILAGLRKAL